MEVGREGQLGRENLRIRSGRFGDLNCEMTRSIRNLNQLEVGRKRTKMQHLDGRSH